MVEIDRGTMPVYRSDPDRTSFEGEIRVYRTAARAAVRMEELSRAYNHHGRILQVLYQYREPEPARHADVAGTAGG
jgi:hypothetical protein